MWSHYGTILFIYLSTRVEHLSRGLGGLDVRIADLFFVVVFVSTLLKVLRSSRSTVSLLMVPFFLFRSSPGGRGRETEKVKQDDVPYIVCLRMRFPLCKKKICYEIQFKTKHNFFLTGSCRKNTNGINQKEWYVSIKGSCLHSLLTSSSI